MTLFIENLQNLKGKDRTRFSIINFTKDLCYISILSLKSDKFG